MNDDEDNLISMSGAPILGHKARERDAFDRYGITELIDPSRKNVAAKKGWFSSFRGD